MSEDHPLPLIEGAFTLVEVLRGRACDTPTRSIYTFLGDGGEEKGSLTCADLDRRARSIGAHLQATIEPGTRALLLCPPGPDYIAAFFGCLYAGVVAVPAYPPHPTRPLPRIQAILADAQSAVALTTSKILSNLELRFEQLPDLATLRWMAVDALQDAAEEWRDPSTYADGLAFLQYTSGSTAAPKGVMVSHENLMENLSLIHHAFGTTPQTRVVLWLPPYHDMGLIGGILQPLYAGYKVALMTPVSFLQNPLSWLQALSRYKATVGGGPNFAYDLCVRRTTPKQRESLELGSWEVAFNGAEPVRHETMERFAAAFEPCGFRREAFYPCYGLAEATLFVTGGRRNVPPITRRFDRMSLERNQAVESPDGAQQAQELVSCGQSPSSQRVVIVDPETRMESRRGRVGEIWVSGPSVARGYWRRDGETEATFGATLMDTKDGPFLRTGDLGFIEDTKLFVTSRIKDLIIIRGRNLYPQDIEATVERCHPALRPGYGAAFSLELGGEERLAIAQEVERHLGGADPEEIVGKIREAIAEQHEVHAHAVVLLKIGGLPRTSSGKIRRHACRADFNDGTLPIVYSSISDLAVEASSEEKTPEDGPQEFDRASVAWDLGSRLAELVGVTPDMIDPGESLNTQGIDSLMAVDMQIHIKKMYGLKIPVEEFTEDITIDQIVGQIMTARTSTAEVLDPQHAT